MSSYEALKKAEDFGLDLVEVAPNASPPVCKIMDFGKYKYEQAKKRHNIRMHQRSMHLKEIKVRPFTDKHDLEIKIRNARGFLEDKNKTKVTLTFRKRERAYVNLGKNIMDAFIEGIKDIGVIEHPPRMEGNNMVMIIAPKPEILKGEKSSK